MSQRWDDGDLLRRYIHQGDEGAFRELASRHAGMVFQLCRRFGKDKHEAEDVTQQVFTTLALKAHTLLDRDNLSGWLRRTAWQIACRSLRAAQVRRRHEIVAATVAANSAPETRLEPDVVPMVHQHLASLSEPYREAISLYYLEGLTVAEVATRMNCPPGTAAARISRGRDLLRASMGPGLWAVVGACAAAETLQAPTEAAAAVPTAVQGGPAMALVGTGTAGASATAVAAPLASKIAAAIFITSFIAGGGTLAGVAITNANHSKAATGSSTSSNGPNTDWLSYRPNPQPRGQYDSAGSRTTQVPEPSTMFMVGAFAAGALLRRRRT